MLFLRRHAPALDEIVCPDAATANELRGDLGVHACPVRIDPLAIAEADFDGAIEQAVSGEFPIADGQLSIERTRAMTMIDIDGSGDPLALNRAAAREMPRLLRLLDIGGPVGIDFLALPDRKARGEIDSALGEACAVLGPHKRTAVNGFGFAQIVRPRPGPSIPELVCGINSRPPLARKPGGGAAARSGPFARGWSAPPGRPAGNRRADPAMAGGNRSAARLARRGDRTCRRSRRNRLWTCPCQPGLADPGARSAASRARRNTPRSAPPAAATATC